VRIEHWKTKKMVWQPLQDGLGSLYPSTLVISSRKLGPTQGCLNTSLSPPAGTAE
jgi:hypothetical protein